MFEDIVSFAILENCKIYVVFESGKKGVFDMKPYTHSSFFSALQDPVYFNRASLQYGVIVWPQGQDISPETIMREMVACNCPDGATIRQATLPESYHSAP